MDVGLDRLLAHDNDDETNALVRRLRTARVGLLAHPASVTRDFVHVLDVLKILGIPPRVIFGPEHGFSGHAQDMIGVADARNEQGARVVSLYGERFEDLSPKRSDVEDLDVVLIDLQDVGARYYTFVWTAVLVARACKDAGVRVVILDRPNPLGETIEGRIQREGFLSFVGLEKVPIRHGLTLGEIVAWRASLEGFEELVHVVAVHGLSEGATAPSWDRPMVMPSPNMPTVDTALVYPGGCLLEGTNLSDGRGTTRPFEITGAPWISGKRLAQELQATGLPGFVARPLTFEPTFHKHAKQSCGGVQIHVTDARVFRPVATYVALVALAHRMHPDSFRFRTEMYEFIDTIPAFDLLTGGDEARHRILAGDDPREIAEYVSATTSVERAIVAEARSVGARSSAKLVSW